MRTRSHTQGRGIDTEKKRRSGPADNLSGGSPKGGEYRKERLSAYPRWSLFPETNRSPRRSALAKTCNEHNRTRHRDREGANHRTAVHAAFAVRDGAVRPDFILAGRVWRVAKLTV